MVVTDNVHTEHQVQFGVEARGFPTVDLMDGLSAALDRVAVLADMGVTAGVVTRVQIVSVGPWRDA